jgi:aspartyl/glutamyl-tRNA(Asn/Gln) amidotransferase C subunit
MADITNAVTAKVADLIKVKIAEAELNQFTDKLSHALDPAAQLAELDTSNVDVLSHPTGLTTIGEADEIGQGLTAEQALANAKRNGRLVLDYIKVPKVINN